MREEGLVRECLARFDLDLSGLEVFTEAATGSFVWTPLIALLAGARRVVAIAKDSRYGSKLEAHQAVRQLSECLKCADRLEVVFDYDTIGSADIVTNVGAVRPIDAAVVRRLKRTAVIPLMWETWEWRPAELDLRACYEAGILVLGTNEHHPALATLRYVGLLAVKLVFEAGLEILGSTIVVVGDKEFGGAIVSELRRLGATVYLVGSRKVLADQFPDLWVGESLGEATVTDALRRADGLVFAEHVSTEVLLGAEAGFSVSDLGAVNPGIRVVHISGRVDAQALRQRARVLVPARIAETPRSMSVTTAYLGPLPVIELHTAGLKVGQEMAHARQAGFDIAAAKQRALANSLCQDFPSAVLSQMGGP